MNFAERFASKDFRDHSTAVVFLRGEGVSGEVHLPGLLEICNKIDIRKQNKSEREAIFIVLSARAMGEIIQLVGFQEQNELHRGCLEWIEGLLSSGEKDSLYAGIWALGDLGVPPNTTIDRLYQIAIGERLENRTAQISPRGLAFRVIAKLDRQIAKTLTERECCREYLQAVDQWSAYYKGKYPENLRIRDELIEEARWIHDEI